MKTVFSIEIHANGNFNDAIVRMVTNNNDAEKNIKIDTDLIEAHCKSAYAMYPTITPETSFAKDGNKFSVYENKKHTITLTSREVNDEQEMELLSKQHLS